MEDWGTNHDSSIGYSLSVIFELEGLFSKYMMHKEKNDLSFLGSFPINLSGFAALESPLFCTGGGAACWTM